MLLDRSQIEQWADTYNAKGDFPLLIQKLVYASTPELTKCNIPFGSAVNMGGFDGEVETTQGSAYIPQGKCILEFGTNKDFKTKAEGDYTTRSENDYEGLNKTETTFLFMTPCLTKEVLHHVGAMTEEILKGIMRNTLWN